MRKKRILVIPLSVILFISGMTNFPTSGQEVPIDIELQILPYAIEVEPGIHKIGLIRLVDLNGEYLISNEDQVISLTSSDPQIAKVPKIVTISAGDSYSFFEIDVGNNIGNTIIEAQLGERSDAVNFQVGTSSTEILKKTKLVIKFPVKVINVNSMIPFSVYLVNSDNEVVKSPKDLEISFTVEKDLIILENYTITLKKNDYYAINFLKTHEKTGNAFVKATSVESNLNAFSDLKIVSSKAKFLSLYVYPEMLSRSSETNFHIFVGVKDEQGNPVLAHEDIPLTIVTEDIELSDRIDDAQKDNKPIIKAGQFGYHLIPNFIPTNAKKMNHTITVSAQNYGIESQLIQVVNPLSANDPKARDKIVAIFVPEFLPTGASSIMVYQVNAIVDEDLLDDTDDPDVVQNIDDLDEDELFPVVVKQKFSSASSVDNLKITTTDNNIVAIKKDGSLIPSKLTGGTTFGFAQIETSEKTGETTISVSMKGLASGSNKTVVINPIEPVSTKIFSPIDDNLIAPNADGMVEIFLIPLDSSNRPTNSKVGLRYLITPINEPIEITQGKYFTKFEIDSSNFKTDGDTTITTIPIGLDPKTKLSSSLEVSNAEFQSEPLLSLKSFSDEFLLEQKQSFVIVQMVDTFGKPLTFSNEKTIRLDSSDRKVIRVPNQITIESGRSFNLIPIEIIGSGTVLVSANLPGFIDDAISLEVRKLGETFQSVNKLIITTQYDEENITIGKPMEIRIFIDDNSAKPISDARIKLSSKNGDVIPTIALSEKDGSATILFTPMDSQSELVIHASKLNYIDSEQTFEFIGKPGNQTEFTTSAAILAGVAVALGVGVFLYVRKSRKHDYEEEEDI